MTDKISHTPTPPALPPPAPSRDTALPELKPKHRTWVWIAVLLIVVFGAFLQVLPISGRVAAEYQGAERTGSAEIYSEDDALFSQGFC